MHSHLGVFSFPTDGRNIQDGNELTFPTFPQVRALDGLSKFFSNSLTHFFFFDVFDFILVIVSIFSNLFQIDQIKLKYLEIYFLN